MDKDIGNTSAVGTLMYTAHGIKRPQGQLAKVNQRIALVYVEGKGEKAQVTGYTFFDEMLEKAYSGRLPEYSLDF